MPIDPAYRAVDPDDFPAMIAPGRYAERSPHFEEIIARTEEHFWNPEDPDYVDFSTPGRPPTPAKGAQRGRPGAAVRAPAPAALSSPS